MTERWVMMMMKKKKSVSRKAARHELDLDV